MGFQGWLAQSSRVVVEQHKERSERRAPAHRLLAKPTSNYLEQYNFPSLHADEVQKSYRVMNPTGPVRH